MTRTVRVSAEQVENAAVRRRRREARVRWTRLGLVALAVLVADQILKETVRGSLAPREDIAVLPGLDITRVTNEGIAFGLFPGRQAVVALLTIVALTAIAIALATLVKRNTMAAVGAGLLLGGSLGNLLDRVIHGGVTDYIDLARWPAFNLADIGITVGAAMIVLGLLRTADDDDRPHGA